MRKRILFITTRLFWPADSGRKVVLYNYCKGLHDQLGYDVYLYSFLEGDQTVDDALEFPNFIKDVRLAAPIAPGTKLLNLIHHLFNGDESFQSALFWSDLNVSAIRAYCEEIEPSFVLIDMIRLAPYICALEGLGIPCVLDYDDLLSKRYERQIGCKSGNILGKYSVQASGFFDSLVSSNVIKNLILSIESNRIKRAEYKYALKGDAVLFVSPLEAAELNDILGIKKCFSATIGADVIESDYMENNKEFDFGFVGNMHTAANQASLEFICDKVLPLISGCSLRVIGVCPSSVSERYSGNRSISFSGSVDSISDELLKCKVLLAPFAYGTGIKTKVLEAMGMGIPVITNSIGIEGMTCTPGVEIEVSETPYELANLGSKLLESPELRASIGISARQYVRVNHDWHKSIESLGNCLDYAGSSLSGD